MGILAGAAAAAALADDFACALAGGPLAFTACELFVATDDGVHSAVAPLSRLRQWADCDPALAGLVSDRLELISAARPAFAGLSLDRPRIVGIVNVTPDSFSDGGVLATPDAAVAHGAALIEAGADMIDIGGASSRPGALSTPEEVELGRVVPVVHGLAGRGVPLSVDSWRPAVMRAAMAAGAAVINDITALTGDATALDAAAQSGAAVILMHMRGEPLTMQHDPVYDHPSYEVWCYLRDRVMACLEGGIPAHRIAVDPGIGFGKATQHNMRILAEMALFHGLGCAVAVGASRKIFHREPLAHRLPGSLAATIAAASQGVQLHRVHDVAEVRQALAAWPRMHAGR